MNFGIARVMGQKYALASGESEAVAAAIEEHYLPRRADRANLGWSSCGLADRLDTLVSIFGLGMLPTGSSDLALRRAANAIINITWTAQLPINLYQMLEQITDCCPSHKKRQSYHNSYGNSSCNESGAN